VLKNPLSLLEYPICLVWDSLLKQADTVIHFEGRKEEMAPLRPGPGLCVPGKVMLQQPKQTVLPLIQFLMEAEAKLGTIHPRDSIGQLTEFVDTHGARGSAR